jgi:hypothetical protein
MKKIKEKENATRYIICGVVMTKSEGITSVMSDNNMKNRTTLLVEITLLK